MKKPVSYLQTDSRWANIDYSTKGESTTIGKSGCGPSCMAMVIATLKNAKITPKDTCYWAKSNGYKALNQGTYYTYFVPQGTAYGVKVSRINTATIYGSSSTTAKDAHAKALAAINAGKWVICCMGKGNWTSSGHFILWYGVDGSNVLINDPNSVKPARTKAALSLLQSQVKFYFIVETEEDHTEEATELVNGLAKVINITDKAPLISALNSFYNGSCWWVLKKAAALDYTGKTAIDGKKDIYRRTLASPISITETAAYNKELIKCGENSIFYAIKKVLDKLGIE